MLICGEFFKTQSDQKIYQNAPNTPYFPNILRGASIMPLSPSIYKSATIVNITILYENNHSLLRFFQNTHQNASIVTCFQKFLHENYPIASMYLKCYFFI